MSYHVGGGANGVQGDNSTDDRGALNSLITNTIAGSAATIHFTEGSYVLASSITFPSNLQLRFDKGAVLKPAAGITVTIEGQIEAGRYQIFDMSPGGAFAFLTGGDSRFIPQWWKTVGSDDTASLNAAGTAARKAALDLGSHHYVVTDLLDFSDLVVISNGAVIERTDAAAEEVIAAQGSAGSYFTLAADASRGQNLVESSALAGVVSPGDLIKIRSDSYFNPSEGTYQGEIHSVESVSGDYVRLSEPLEDSYATLNNARACKVTTTTFHIEGRLQLRRDGGDDASATRGIRVAYGYRPQIDIEVINAKDIAIAFEDCYAPVVKFLVVNSVLSTSTQGYGLSIANATMYGRFEGCAMSSRHCVTFGAAPAEGGVPWGNHVRATGVGGYSAQVFDAHASCGSVYWDDCVAIGGIHTKPNGVTARPSAFATGARFTFVKNCSAMGCGNLMDLDSSIGASDRIEVLDIDGLESSDGAGHGLNIPTAWAGTIGTLRITGLRGQINDADGWYAIALNAFGTIEHWSFSDIDVRGALLYVAGTGSTPANLQLQSCRSESESIPTLLDTTDTAIRIANPNVTNLVLHNVSLMKHPIGVRLSVGLEKLMIYDCEFDQNFVHLYVDASVPPLDVQIVGGWARRSQHGQATYGFISIINSGDYVERLLLEGFGLESDQYVVGHSGGVKVAVHGSSRLSAALTDIGRLNPVSAYEIVAGSFGAPRILRGAGSPEASVTAPIGALFQRLDGSTGSSLYVKESGTGSTGWVAK